MNTLLELYCNVDDFVKKFSTELEKIQLEQGVKARKPREKTLSLSEVMTIIIYFHQIGFRTFKQYYQQYVLTQLSSEFPELVSYNRFVELMPSVMLLLGLFVHFQSKTQTGIYFIDSTTLDVCHIKRAHSNRVFKKLAAKGKSSMGWFFGFKLHLIINELGEIIAFKVTKGNVDDRVPVEKISTGLKGKLIGDRGYISQKLFDQLFQNGLKLITKVKKNMKNKLMPEFDKYLLRKRAIVESVNDQLKNISQIEHSRHRSVNNFIVNLLAGLAAYALKDKKPSLHLNHNFLIAA